MSATAIATIPAASQRGGVIAPSSEPSATQLSAREDGRRGVAGEPAAVGPGEREQRGGEQRVARAGAVRERSRAPAPRAAARRPARGRSDPARSRFRPRRAIATKATTETGSTAAQPPARRRRSGGQSSRDRQRDERALEDRQAGDREPEGHRRCDHRGTVATARRIGCMNASGAQAPTSRPATASHAGAERQAPPILHLSAARRQRRCATPTASASARSRT